MGQPSLPSLWGTTSTCRELGSQHQDPHIDKLVVPPPPQPEPGPSGTPSGATATTGSAHVQIQQNINSFVAGDSVLTIEILWALKSVIDHYSVSSSSNVSALFQIMCPDSAIARKFACGKTKCSYLIKFSLAPYFHSQMMDILSDPKCLFSILFDESFNKVLQQEQMDLIMRYRVSQHKQVMSRYLTSEFLGHTRAPGLHDKFLAALACLNLGNMVQIGMDGPSTNCKFFSDFQEQHKQNHPEFPLLLNLGSCSLHVVCGALKSGAQATGWALDSLLRSMYYLLHDSPARREDYLQKHPDAKLPMQFCSTQWLENVPVAQRAITIWPYVSDYVQAVSRGPKKAIPTIKSFQTVLEGTKDPLVPDKLQFFITVAQLLKPYLQKYQTEKQMMVFIAEDLEKLLRTLMQKCLKKASLMKQIRLSSSVASNLMIRTFCVTQKQVELGFGIRASLRQLEKDKKVSALQIKKFEVMSQNFLLTIIKKILKKSPLQSQFVRSLQSLDPRVIAETPDNAKEKFRRVLNNLLACRRMSADDCDEAMRQYGKLLFNVGKYKKKYLQRVLRWPFGWILCWSGGNGILPEVVGSVETGHGPQPWTVGNRKGILCQQGHPVV